MTDHLTLRTEWACDPPPPGQRYIITEYLMRSNGWSVLRTVTKWEPIPENDESPRR